MSNTKQNYKLVTRPDVLGSACTVTGISREILNLNINTDKLEEFGYKPNDLMSVKFDPLKNFDKLCDLKEAGVMIMDAMSNGEHILLVSDYDADGLTSAVTMELAFSDVFEYDTLKWSSMVNKRVHGNGFNKTLISRIKEIHDVTPIGLVITADHGSSNNTSFRDLKEYGIGKVLLTDHHHIPAHDYPNSTDLVVNPQRLDCAYHKDVSGCYVAFMVMYSTWVAMGGKKDWLRVFKDIVPFVGLSVITDVMSLDSPVNRQLVKLGLAIINTDNTDMYLWENLRAKLYLQGAKKYTPKHLGWNVGPVINTGNRLSIEDSIFETMKAKDYAVSLGLVTEAVKANAKRKSHTKKILQAVLGDIPKPFTKHSMVVVNGDTTMAINGVLANNIGGLYGVPVIVCSKDPYTGVYACSGRANNDSLNVLDVMAKVVSNSRGVVLAHGGHAAAMGCGISPGGLDEFRLLFDRYVVELAGTEVDDTVVYNFETTALSLSTRTAIAVDRLAPYGKGWPEPRFRGTFSVASVSIKGSYARIALRCPSGVVYRTVYFFNPVLNGYTIDNIVEALPTGTVVDVVHTIELNKFNRDTGVGINIVDIHKKE